MRYWVQLASEQPQQLTVEEVAQAFGLLGITWDTPACEIGASDWTAVRHIPALVAAIRARGISPVPAQPGLVSAPSIAIAAQFAAVSPPPPSGHSEIAKLEQYRNHLAAEIDALKSELASVEEAVEIQSFGFYRPRYGFEHSEQYSERLEQIREEQEQLLKTDKATRCEKKWVVDGSAQKGAAMARDQSQLMLRAFNGECDAAISKVKYDNVTNLEKRIEKALAAINKLGASKHIEIAPEYSALKLEELHLVHEHREKLHEEREAQRAIKDQMKEEQKAEAEIRAAVERAQKEEAVKEEALERARRELAEATGRQHEKLEQLVSRLENELSEALNRKAKAIARAQLTRSGHVYVLSNVGCFGPDFYKIGMTRRLEPLERVQELGDASVPFQFDVHAMIYSEDAPALEKALHDQFADRRVNLVNLRKEFFQVTLDEIREGVGRLHGTVTFVTSAAAEEYHKTRAITEDRARALKGDPSATPGCARAGIVRRAQPSVFLNAAGVISSRGRSKTSRCVPRRSKAQVR